MVRSVSESRLDNSYSIVSNKIKSCPRFILDNVIGKEAKVPKCRDFAKEDEFVNRRETGRRPKLL